jgi:hypothetical protein
MAKPRVYTDPETEAGVYHVCSRVVDGRYIFGEPEKEEFVRMMRSLAAFHGAEILTYCVMSNHFHILLRVPRRPEGFDLPLETVLERWKASVGDAWRKGMTRQFALYEESGNGAVIEEWRQRMLGRMFRLTEFAKSLKQRFSQWYNRRAGRKGTLWEGRYKSVIVEDDHTALRTMSAYIDLNPVRAGMVSDPGDYRWCGYADAMAGNALAIEGLVRVTGWTAERVHGRALGAPVPAETDRHRRRRELQALVRYRQLLGIAGKPRVDEDGRSVRRGVSEAVRGRLAREQGIRTELLLRRVRHLTDGVILGSRGFIDGWFERNRSWFGGKSREQRKTGARRIGKEWQDLYNLRQLRE